MSDVLRRGILTSLQGGGSSLIDVNNVFSTDLWTGSGISQDITNGFDATTNDVMVWVKNRDRPIGHIVTDTLRGATNHIQTESTTAQYNVTNLVNSFNNDGFTVGTGDAVNRSVETYVAWSFLKSPKFFDVITYTGDGVSGREIPHSLGCQAGMVFVKRLDSGFNWRVQHISRGGTVHLALNNSLDEEVSAPSWNSTAATDQVVTLGHAGEVNASGGQYVMYVFAHDDSEGGVIQCGGYVGTGVTDNKITLGWRPQFILIKSATVNTTSWVMLDTTRGINTGVDDPRIYAESSDAELTNTNWVELDVDGFRIKPTFGQVNTAGEEYIYMAIRIPESFIPPQYFYKTVDSFTVTMPLARSNTIGFEVEFDMFITDDASTLTTFILGSSSGSGGMSIRLINDDFYVAFPEDNSNTTSRNVSDIVISELIGKEVKVKAKWYDDATTKYFEIYINNVLRDSHTKAGTLSGTMDKIFNRGNGTGTWNDDIRISNLVIRSGSGSTTYHDLPLKGDFYDNITDSILTDNGVEDVDYVFVDK